MKIRGVTPHSIAMACVVCLMTAWGAERGAAQGGRETAYRIVIIENQDLNDATEVKRMLDGLGVRPVYLDDEGNTYRVLYGHFLTQDMAIEARRRLDDDGVNSVGLTRAGTAAPLREIAAPRSFTIVIKFPGPAEAEEAKRRLTDAGFSNVEAYRFGIFHNLRVGVFTQRDSFVALGRILNMDYRTAQKLRIKDLEARLALPPPGEVQPPTVDPETLVTHSIMQQDVFKNLSEERQKEVIEYILIEREQRKGNPLANQVLDLNKRLARLDDQVSSIIGRFEQERSEVSQLQKDTDELKKQAENLILAGEFNRAMQSLQGILERDRDNKLGLRYFVESRIRYCQTRLQGYIDPGMAEQTAARIKTLEDRAKQLASGSIGDRKRAIGLYDQISSFDPNYPVEDQVRALSAGISTQEQNRATASPASDDQLKKLQTLGGGVGGGLLLLLIILWFRGLQRHKALIKKVHEITSIRPMREMEGGGAPLIDTAGGGTESEIFSPRQPSAASKSIDPLGGVAPSPVAPPQPAAPEEPADDLFADISESGPTSPAAEASATDDLGLDELFGGEDTSTSQTGSPPETTEMVEVPETEQSTTDADELFADLFSDEDTQGNLGEVEETAPPPAPEPASIDTGPISFDEMMGEGSDQTAGLGSEEDSQGGAGAEDDDLLSVFDEPAGQGGEEPPGGRSGPSGTAQKPGVKLDFESEPAGQTAPGWQMVGNAATLQVHTESPPRGSHQYICYEKHEGNGQGLFSYSFNPVHGKLSIEFDICCHDKNKYLLGFFIEKDGQSEGSIHTKILRSEAQTTPTIHMQGESAPYFLASWAHIRYTVDLIQGTVDGYIDGTHVARGVQLEQPPAYLNTLSIRDNTSTTGVLLLDNIKVSQLG